MLSVGTTLALSATDWNSGGIARTIMTVMAWMFQTEDVFISQIAQGGFLDYAASGTVSYVNSNGVTVVVPVTLDPSTNPGAPPGFLDALSSSIFNVTRIGAAGGAGVEVIWNTGGQSGSYAAGTYHILNPTAGLTYSNTGPITISAGTLVGASGGVSIASISNTAPVMLTLNAAHGLSSGAYVGVSGTGTALDGQAFQVLVVSSTQLTLTGSRFVGALGAGGQVWLGQGANFTADILGPGVSAPGSISQAVTALPGVNVTNLVPFVGQAAESNIALATRDRLKLASLSPNGAPAAYQYVALTAYQWLVAGGLYNPSGTFNLVTAAVTKSLPILNTTTGTVSLYLANANGPVTGVTNLQVTGATNASPTVISTAASFVGNLQSGSVVSITGVQGNLAANGNFTISVLTSNSFSIAVDSTGSGTYVSGTGSIEGGDLGEIDALIHRLCVPNAVTEITTPATAVSVIPAGTIYVLSAYASQALAMVNAALATYATNLNIGGVTLQGEGTNVAPYDEILGVAEGAMPQIQNINNFTLNGQAKDVQLGPTGLLGFGQSVFTVIAV
jgi:hypothetical protein